jgi:glycosyltransferase involved in cell wall biosynthesis
MMLSLVIPTLNHAPFIRRCIDSCLSHDFQDAEVIVIDGASADGTQEILAEYGDRSEWFSEPDRGQSDAVNKGVLKARGEIIAWINSDDYYPKGGLLKQVVALFEADPMLDIVYGDAMMVDIQGRPIRRFRSFEMLSGKQILIRPARFVCQPALFFRRQVFLDTGGLSTNLHWAMDLDLWLRMFPLARRVLYIPAVLACATYHLHAKSVEGMLSQIREIRSVIRNSRGQFLLSFGDQLRLCWGEIRLYLYWVAVKLRLRRAV